MEAEGSHLDLVSIRSKDGSMHLVKNSWVLPAFYCLPMDILDKREEDESSCDDNLRYVRVSMAEIKAFA